MMEPSEFDQLRDIDRPRTTVHFDAWGRDVTLQAIDAVAWARIADAYENPEGAQALEFSADLLAACCVDPQLTRDQWLQLSFGALVDLGGIAMKLNGLRREEKKRDP
jgi:hypothetical protein